jgi:hypothetical protein
LTGVDFRKDKKNESLGIHNFVLIQAKSGVGENLPIKAKNLPSGRSWWGK